MTEIRDPTRGRRRRILIVVAVVISLLIGTLCVAFVYTDQVRSEKEREYWEYYNKRLAIFETENGMYAEHEVDVAFLGDSITDGCDLGRYYSDYTFVNRGIGGDTTFYLKDRLDISIYKLKPKVAVILIGTNNIHSMLDDYEDIILDIREHTPKTEIVICSLTPMGAKWAERNSTAAYNNVILDKLAEKHGCEYVDLFTPLFDEDTGEIRKEYTVEGLHLTHEAYLVTSALIRPIISDLLEGWGDTVPRTSRTAVGLGEQLKAPDDIPALCPRPPNTPEKEEG